MNADPKSSTFTFSLVVAKNLPVTKSGTATNILNVEIDIHSTDTSFSTSVAPTIAFCSDPESDTIKEYLYYNGYDILTQTDDTGLHALVSHDATTHKITVDGGIKSNGVATYSLVYACKDEYNDDAIIFPFRFVVYDKFTSPSALHE
jgi:hypothetical protein